MVGVIFIIHLAVYLKPALEEPLDFVDPASLCRQELFFTNHPVSVLLVLLQ